MVYSLIYYWERFSGAANLISWRPNISVIGGHICFPMYANDSLYLLIFQAVSKFKNMKSFEMIPPAKRFVIMGALLATMLDF